MIIIHIENILYSSCTRMIADVFLLIDELIEDSTDISYIYILNEIKNSEKNLEMIKRILCKLHSIWKWFVDCFTELEFIWYDSSIKCQIKIIFLIQMLHHISLKCVDFVNFCSASFLISGVTCFILFFLIIHVTIMF